MNLKVIAHIHSDFPTKFGVPRQSGLAPSLQSIIVFEPEYRAKEALRGLEQFSHLWLIWGFSESFSAGWSPTVRPPRLGGNTRMGVFATRSPFRPNPIGLSSVQLLSIREDGANGTVLLVSGADLMNGTPIYDIKPYIPYADSHPDASGGFAESVSMPPLKVLLPDSLAAKLPIDKRNALIELLSLDPRPAYQDDSSRVYGLAFAGFEIHFTVCGTLLTVVDVNKSCISS